MTTETVEYEYEETVERCDSEQITYCDSCGRTADHDAVDEIITLTKDAAVETETVIPPEYEPRHVPQEARYTHADIHRAFGDGVRSKRVTLAHDGEFHTCPGCLTTQYNPDGVAPVLGPKPSDESHSASESTTRGPSSWSASQQLVAQVGTTDVARVMGVLFYAPAIVIDWLLSVGIPIESRGPDELSEDTTAKLFCLFLWALSLSVAVSVTVL